MKHYLSRLQDTIAANWDRNALCDYGGAGFTFGSMATHIARLHLLFSRLGIRKGDKLSLCGKNQARWGVSFFAVNTCEAVAVPILADFTPRNICAIVNHSESVVLFTDEDIFKKLDMALMPSVKAVISLADFSLLYGRPGTGEIFDSLQQCFDAAHPHGFSACDVHYPTGNDKDLAVINYTSGSTGDPKGVMLRYECFSANVEFALDHVLCHPGDRILSILPMAHMFGLTFEMLYPLCGGATIHFLGKTPGPTLLLKAMAEVRPYLVVAVPMVFEKIYRGKLRPLLEKPSVKVLTKIPGVRNMIFSRMRRSIEAAFGGNVREFVMGGAAVNPEVEQFFRRIGFHFTVGYGMTEAAPLMAYTPWKSFVLHSCGRRMDYVRLRIDSEDPAHVVGEIQARGINLFSGYFKNEKATQAAFTPDGWFNTGDLGLIDEQGNVYIKGRCKSMLLSSNGQNIYPEEIECELNSLPYVAESLVVSREGKLTALVFADEAALRGDGINLETLREDLLYQINAKVPKYSLISKVEFMQEPFQKTPKQSIRRFLYK